MSRAAVDILQRYVVHGPDLLGNQSDRISYSTFSSEQPQASLALVVPQDLQWLLTTSYTGSRQTRALFRLSGQQYNLVVTDPAWEHRLSTLTHGQHPLTAAGLATDDEVLLTISVGEPLQDTCYKLVAAVIVLPGSWRGKIRGTQRV